MFKNQFVPKRPDRFQFRFHQITAFTAQKAVIWWTQNWNLSGCYAQNKFINVKTSGFEIVPSWMCRFTILFEKILYFAWSFTKSIKEKMPIQHSVDTPLIKIIFISFMSSDLSCLFKFCSCSLIYNILKWTPYIYWY